MTSNPEQLCPTCEGYGLDCPTCRGSGYVTVRQRADAIVADVIREGCITALVVAVAVTLLIAVGYLTQELWYGID